jgi:hypothetical protein
MTAPFFSSSTSFRWDFFRFSPLFLEGGIDVLRPEGISGREGKGEDEEEEEEEEVEVDDEEEDEKEKGE